MEYSLCTFILLALVATVSSQVFTCSECNDCPSNTRCRSLALCNRRVASGTCRIISSSVTGDEDIGNCAIVTARTVLNSITGTDGVNCLILENDVLIRGTISLGGSADYLSMATNVRTGAIDMGPGRDCVVGGTRIRTETINLGTGADQLHIQQLDTLVDANGMMGDVLGGGGRDCIAIGPNVANKKRSVEELDEIFASFKAENKRALPTLTSEVRDVLAEGGRDCIKLDCVEFRNAAGGSGDDCLEATAGLFHQLSGGTGSDILSATDFETFIDGGNGGSISGGRDSDTIQASGSRGSTAVVDGTITVGMEETIDRCCTSGPAIIPINCDQSLAFPCVSVP